MNRTLGYLLLSVSLLVIPSCAPLEEDVPTPDTLEDPAEPVIDDLGCAAGLACDDASEFDFIVVGSGAGGGPLAANLARAGYKVLLLEAGEYVGNTLNYAIPTFAGAASEDPAMAWSFFAHHYDDDERQANDPNVVLEEDGSVRGVLYPRGSALGGSTAVNNMITVYPHESDWSNLVARTGDVGWAPSRMRQHFVSVERNRYLADVPLRSSRGHGFSGWLSVERPSPLLFFGDLRLKEIVFGAAEGYDPDRAFEQIFTLARRDINESGPARDGETGLFTVPMATSNGRRNGTAEHILRTMSSARDTLGRPNLSLQTGALVTRVILTEETGTLRAAGVEYLPRRHAYGASARATDLTHPAPELLRRVHARREVILSAGAFNTPQLLMLSGIGPRAHLEEMGIEPRVDLPGVGSNLQDRYEIGVVHDIGEPLGLSAPCTFAPTRDIADPCRDDWDRRRGTYTANGVIASVLHRSSVSVGNPDLFMFAVGGDFRGYRPGYAADAAAGRSRITWVILKAHTRNHAGTVRLRSDNPLERPDIRFRYFDEGSEGWIEDRQALVEAVSRVRGIADATNERTTFEEVYPGRDIDTQEEVEAFVSQTAWGHHACGTAAIGGDDDPNAVLDSRFRVRGVQALRVVDASVFPDIPGFFIVVPTYMISERAAVVIAEDNPR